MTSGSLKGLEVAVPLAKEHRRGHRPRQPEATEGVGVGQPASGTRASTRGGKEGDGWL